MQQLLRVPVERGRGGRGWKGRGWEGMGPGRRRRMSQDWQGRKSRRRPRLVKFSKAADKDKEGDGGADMVDGGAGGRGPGGWARETPEGWFAIKFDGEDRSWGLGQRGF